jgi:NADH:ubiquinone oxidoreductase subunit 6 (subunit J)
VVPIGRALLGTHLFAFEFVTLLLVAAIVGAVYLARRESR